MCFSSLEKCLFKSFVHFKIWLYVCFLLLSCSRSLYILNITLYMICRYFSHSVGCLFTILVLVLSFDEQKLFNFDEIQLSIFPFVLCALGVICEKSLPSPNDMELFRYVLRVL